MLAFWFLFLLVAVGVIGFCLIIRANAKIYPLIFATMLAVAHYCCNLENTTLIISFFALLIFTSIFFVKPIRRMMITPLIFRWFSKVLPPMSQTEKEAIEAGDTWYEAKLFQGNPMWDEMLCQSNGGLSSEEQEFIDKKVDKLCSMLDDWQITHKDMDLSEKAWNYIKKEKFFSLLVPKEYGGLDFSAAANSTIVMKIATKSLSAAVTVMVPNSLGPAELLIKYGTEDQKNEYLPKLVTGQHIPCFGLTGVEAGSDAGSIPDTAIICRGKFNGKEVLGAKLTFNKRYITLAPVATLVGLAVKTYDPDGLLSPVVERGITVFLLSADTKGVDIGKRHLPLDQAFMNGPIRGNDVFVPLSFIIGGEEKIGSGWRMLTECLAAGRGISLPALGTAIAKLSLRTTSAYSKVRKQFNLSIGKFEGVSTKMGEIGGFTYLLEASRLFTVSSLDAGYHPSVVTAIAKYHMTEIGRKVLNNAMDIHGGKGIILGESNYLGRLYEGVPIAITVEGANILTRCLIIFGQGAIRCHPYVLTEMLAVEKGQSEGLIEFDEAFFSHVYYSVANIAKLKFHSFTGMLLLPTPKNCPSFLAKYYKSLGFFSVALSVTSDLSMLILGGDLKRRENLSARLGDVLSYLYMAAASLKYFNDNGGKEAEIPYLTFCLNYCLQEIHNAFIGFYDNFPNRFVGFSLKMFVSPMWRTFSEIKDKVYQQISDDVMTQSPTRERLLEYSYVGQKNCPIGVVEKAFFMMLELEPLLNKLEKATKKGEITKGATLTEKIAQGSKIGVISAVEAKELIKFDEYRIAAINVDDYANSELVRR